MATPQTTDPSGPLPQFSLFDENEEFEDKTVRRVFAPRKPPRVAVEITDADATWKWEPRRADAIGQFVGVALPVLDGEAGLEFEPSEVEVTQEIFALRPVAAAIPLANRRVVTKPVARPLPRTSPARRRGLAIALASALATLVTIIAVAAIAGLHPASTFFRSTRTAQPAAKAAPVVTVERPAIDLPPIVVSE